ncbi:transcription factor bHLH36 isoform X2 [Ricinus communis]|uniref:transcription factor bHLH36 isoform X2 n=1 Tax=Ricinus communis TaxID=3988 RepID=UPI00201AE1DA|nr:transcription factor bHLH36 isoform X2 [Ricinus communis]
MFPLQQGNELCFKISSNPHQQQHTLIPQDLILDHPELLHACTDVTHNVGKSRRQKLMSADNNNKNDHGINTPSLITNDKKKMMHRDIERQRRQEMATLHASLRSLLPLEYIKGKRSISDHMNEAVNYIKHLRKRIEELDTKRDELKQQMNIRDIPSGSSGGSSGDCSPSSGVLIRPCLGGIEISFSSNLREKGQGFTLSRVLQVLLEAEISVVNCVSTNVNKRVLHTIQTETVNAAVWHPK